MRMLNMLLLKFSVCSMAIAYVKKTLNVTLYEEIHKKLVDALRLVR